MNIGIYMINIRSINAPKLGELIKSVEEDSQADMRKVICITETHEKFDKVQIPKGYKYVTRRRDEGDKKGGGLMIIVEDYTQVSKNLTNSTDILDVAIEIDDQKLRMMLVYMDVSSEERNIKIRRELNEVMGNVEDGCKLMIMGDFNGHLGFLGNQNLDRNGRFVLDFIDRNNLILLNADDRCCGVITREENGVGSAIDFVLVNGGMYDCFRKMEIDERKELFDLSDHCMIKVECNLLCRKESSGIREREIVEYYCVKEEMKDPFVADLESRITLSLSTGEHLSLENFEMMMRQSADKVLKKVFTKMRDGKTQKVDPPWFNREIEGAIKTRKKYNRLRRNAKTDEDRDYWWAMYLSQKKEVGDQVKRAITNYEQKLATEIRENMNPRKKWDYIRKLRKNENETKVGLYDELGREIEELEKRNEVLMEYWSSVYRQHELLIFEVWNSDIKQEYINAVQDLPSTRLDINYLSPVDRDAAQWVFNFLGQGRNRAGGEQEGERIREGFVERIEQMRLLPFTESEIKSQLRKIKSGKQAGLDGLKPEIYKWIGDSSVCMELIRRCLNELLSKGIIPETWRTSRTVLIPKKSKPNFTQLRPVSLNNVSYKLFMSLVKDKIFEHMKEQKCVSDLQAGFTKGKRVEDNLTILRYCIGESRKMKRPLYITAIDFAKAFDSINRKQIINVLKKYRCDPLIIDIIAQIYSQDRTELWFDGREVGLVDVSSGIRQGCTGSPWLFVMVMNEIIEKMILTKVGFRNNLVKIPILMFADDGLLLTQTRGDMITLIRKINEISNELGMKINKEKSMILTINTDDNEPIEGIITADNIKYLGKMIGKEQDCFKKHKEMKIKDCRRMSNLTYSVITKSCNMVLIGKTYWMSVALTSILY